MGLLTPAKQRARGRAERPTLREKFLLFRAGEGIYGMGLSGLWEVLMPDGVTTLPTPPYQICTALAYRGRRLPLIRLGELFGDSTDRVPATARVLLTEAQGRALGLLVDEVLEMTEVNPSHIAPMPALATLLNPRFFRGLFRQHDRVILLINTDGLGGLDEVARFYSAGS